jgi:hypothetical protein
VTEQVVDVNVPGLDGLLAAMNDAPFSLVARWSHRQPGEEDGESGWHPMATYQLDVDSFLSWKYVVRSSEGSVDYEASCDGTTYRRWEAGHGIQQRIPRQTSLDDPLPFYSWLAIPETWVVELVRPLDLLALVFVDEAESVTGAGDVCRLAVRPIGREPSPYGGIAQPHRSTCGIVLDLTQGAIREATVRQAGELTDQMEIVRLTRSRQ